MYFSITMCDDSLYQEAKWFFLSQWRSDLLVRAPSSLIWAYLVTQYMWKKWKSQFSFMEWIYSCEELFFSLSHSEDMIWFVVDTKKVAIDLEYIRERDESLLHNVHIPDSPYSPRENFYLQWCAKECVVKFLNITSTEMQEMSVWAFIRNHHYVINDWTLDSLILINYRWREYPVHITIKEGKVLAMLHEIKKYWTL